MYEEEYYEDDIEILHCHFSDSDLEKIRQKFFENGGISKDISCVEGPDNLRLSSGHCTDHTIFLKTVKDYMDETDNNSVYKVVHEEFELGLRQTDRGIISRCGMQWMDIERIWEDMLSKEASKLANAKEETQQASLAM